MTVIIEVSGELETALKAQAQEQGLTADRLAHRVLARTLTPGLEDAEDAPATPAWTNGKEKALAFARWVKSHRDTPPLSDEAVSRASMYPDRG